MANIIKAVCVTASADDAMGRVRLKSEGTWNQPTELVQTVNGCALNVGDVVFVSIEDGYYAPLVLGKADRNDVVLNLLVERLNASEDKVNELVKQLNNVVKILEASSAVVVEGVAGTWSGAKALSLAITPLKSLPNKTTLKDIQDNYK